MIERRTTNAAAAERLSVFASWAWAWSTGARVNRRSSQPFTRDCVPWQRAQDSAFVIGWITAYSVSFPPGEVTTVVRSKRCKECGIFAHDERRGQILLRIESGHIEQDAVHLRTALVNHTSCKVPTV